LNHNRQSQGTNMALLLNILGFPDMETLNDIAADQLVYWVDQGYTMGEIGDALGYQRFPKKGSVFSHRIWGYPGLSKSLAAKGYKDKQQWLRIGSGENYYKTKHYKARRKLLVKQLSMICGQTEENLIKKLKGIPKRDLIKEARKRFTMRELADFFGISYQRIQQIEKKVYKGEEQ